MPGRRKINSQGMWEMFYSDIEPGRDITGKVGASLTEPDAPPLPRDPEAAAALFSVEDDSDQELENAPFLRGASGSDGDASDSSGRQKKKAMVVVSEKDLDTSKPFIFQPKSAHDDERKYTKSMESIDLENEQSEANGSLSTNRFRIRRESDLELAMPTSQTGRYTQKYCYYCLRCYNLPIWTTYFTVVFVGVIMVLLYIIIVITIWRALGA